MGSLGMDRLSQEQDWGRWEELGNVWEKGWCWFLGVRGKAVEAGRAG